MLVYLGAARGVESARRDARFLRLCGIRRLIGVPLTEDMQQNRWMEAEQVWEPESERLARNIAELGDARLESPASWDLRLTAAEMVAADTTIRSVLPNWEPLGSVWDADTR